MPHKTQESKTIAPNNMAQIEQTIEYEEFSHFFEGEDISEEEAQEFLNLYWALALEIMSIGFGFHPVQQAMNCCGKPHGTSDNPPLLPAEKLYLNKEIISSQFKQSTDL